VLEIQIYSRTSHKGQGAPLERLTGDTTDIPEWIEFEFYDLVLYWDELKPSKTLVEGLEYHIT